MFRQPVVRVVIKIKQAFRDKIRMILRCA